MKKYLMEKVLTTSPAALESFLESVYNSSPTAKSVLTNLLETVVFPWYAQVSGQHRDEKKVRDAIAQRIEKDIAPVEWTLSKKPKNDRISPKFRVLRVTPEYIGEGEYVMAILLAPSEGGANVQKVTLATLLLNFRPVGVVSFAEYDS